MSECPGHAELTLGCQECVIERLRSDLEAARAEIARREEWRASMRIRAAEKLRSTCDFHRMHYAAEVTERMAAIMGAAMDELLDPPFSRASKQENE